MPNLLDRLKERKLGQWALAYLAGAFFVYTALDPARETWDIPSAVVRMIHILLIFGFFITLVLAWYHGERGRQRVSGPELLMVAALLVIAGVAVSLLGSDADIPKPGIPDVRGAEDGRPVILVLVCDNISPDPDDAYFAEGLHEAILHRLAQISGLASLGRETAKWYRDNPVSPSEISTREGLDFVGECSVRKDPTGGRILVTFQLLDGGGVHVWSQEYDSDLTVANLFEIQGGIAQEVADRIGVTLTPEESVRMQAVPTGSLTAYDLYLLGRARWWSREPSALEESLGLYQAAIEEDPGFALPYAGLAQTYLLLPSYSMFSEVDVHDLNRRAKEAARTALELDPTLSEAHSALAYIANLYDWDWADAERHFSLALLAEPDNAQALAWYSEVLTTLGRVDEAVEMASRAAEIDPHFYSTRIDLALALWNSGDGLAAEQELRAQMEALPGSPAPYFWLAFLYRLSGRAGDLGELQEEMSAATAGPGQAADYGFGSLGVVWSIPDNPIERQEALNTVRAFVPNTPRQSIMCLLWASLLAELGAIDEGIEVFQAMVAGRSPFVPFMNSRLIPPVYWEHPGFLAILDEVGLPRPLDLTGD